MAAKMIVAGSGPRARTANQADIMAPYSQERATRAITAMSRSYGKN